MLPAERRLRRSEDFARTVRRGRRAGSRHVVVHLLLEGTAPRAGLVAPAGAPSAAPSPPDRPSPLVNRRREGAADLPPARAGLVVPRAVGGAVVRTRVKRRLRALLATRVPSLPPGACLVVRAGPQAAGAPSSALAHSLDAALARLGRPR